MSDSPAGPIEPDEPTLHLVSSIAPADPLGARAHARYRVQPVTWGDGRRFRVRDTVTNTVLAIRATRRGAEDEVIALNMLSPAAPGYGPVPEPEPVMSMARQLHPARRPATDRTTKARG